MDTQEAFVQSLADDAVSIAGTDYLPVGKPNSYKDYELIYYINDVTIDNEEVLVEYGAAGTATGTYEYGLQRLSVEHVNEAKEYYLYNGTGNVTQTTAENGSMFLRYTYDAFGNISSIRAPMTVDIDDLNRYTYNGEDYDYNTGLQYLRARYYDTSVGSFISQDTYLGNQLNPLSQNRYTYCHNSPVMFDDPSGHFALSTLAIIGLVTLGVGVVTAIVGTGINHVAENNIDEAQENLNELQDEIDANATYLQTNTQEAIEIAYSFVENCKKLEKNNKWANAGNVVQTIGIGLSVGGLAITGAGLLPSVVTAVGSIGTTASLVIGRLASGFSSVLVEYAVDVVTNVFEAPYSGFNVLVPSGTSLGSYVSAFATGLIPEVDLITSVGGVPTMTKFQTIAKNVLLQSVVGTATEEVTDGMVNRKMPSVEDIADALFGEFFSRTIASGLSITFAKSNMPSYSEAKALSQAEGGHGGRAYKKVLSDLIQKTEEMSQALDEGIQQLLNNTIFE